eukprot:TRINITY_DN22_c0_g2_i1.p1 TRINITY_DN22_c0_g2~~TRINITY_DN22_c0_g2_i1.p1  ORF type:complete len:732 (+),score=185.01 TRINITY_DN22_c0_g2_i1:301-2196(+)
MDESSEQERDETSPTLLRWRLGTLGDSSDALTSGKHRRTYFSSAPPSCSFIDDGRFCAAGGSSMSLDDALPSGSATASRELAFRKTETDVRSDAQKEENIKWKMHLRNAVSRRLETNNGTLRKSFSSYLGLRWSSCSFSSSRTGVTSTAGATPCSAAFPGAAPADASPSAGSGSPGGSASGVPAVRRRRSRTSTGLPPSRLEIMLDSNVFHSACATIIILNALFIGVQTEVSVRGAVAEMHRGEAMSRSALAEAHEAHFSPRWVEVLNLVFVVLFFVEVLLRICGLGARFFCGPDWKWNLFDVVLLSSSVAEEIVQGFTLTFFRILRGFKMVRVLRIMRVMRFFRELRLMVVSILQSLGSVTWALGLLVVLKYLFAICLVHGVTNYLCFGEDAEVREQLSQWYGSVAGAMFTLLLAISGGKDWEELVEPLAAISIVYKIAFSLYVVFVLIGVLNVLTSVFVERARELSALDRDLAIQAELKQNEAFIREMREIFEEADADGSGSITWVKFKAYLENEQVRAYFATHNLDTSEAHELFRLLAGDSGEDCVDIEEFVMGCMRLKGQAKSADMMVLLRETKILNRKLRTLAQRVDSRFDALMRGAASPDATPAALDAADVSRHPRTASESRVTV